MEIADGIFEPAVESAAEMLEERGATAAEIAVVVNGMEREHQKLRTEGINAAFRGLAGETLH